MKTPFSVSGWSPETPGVDNTRPNEISSDSIELSFDENHSENLKKLEEFERFIFEHAFKNCKEIFGKNQEKVVVESNFTQSIRYSLDPNTKERDDKYPARLKGKLVKDENGKYATKFYNSNKKLLDVNYENFLDHIPKMSECVSIFECSTVWVVNGKFGIGFRPLQMKIYKNETALNDYAFVDEDEENEYTDVSEVEEVEQKVKDLDMNPQDILPDSGDVSFLDELDQDNSVVKEKKPKKKA